MTTAAQPARPHPALQLPSDDYRRTATVEPSRLAEGLDATVLRFAGWWRRTWRRADARELQAVAARAIDEAGRLRTLADSDIDDRIRRCAEDVRLGRIGADDPGMLGLVAEVSRRVLHLEPYPVQLMAAAGIARGFLLEMATGEGKTLTIALAACGPGWRREPCHVITANDYLARRDAAQMARFYERCGLRVASVTGDLDARERRAAYQADVVYTTAKELLADFLRDRLRLGEMQAPSRRAIRALADGDWGSLPPTVTRGVFSVIVDEADSLLVDEAVTPLLISRTRPDPALAEGTIVADRIAADLKEGIHYRIDEQHRGIVLRKPSGPVIAEGTANVAGPYRNPAWMRGLVEQALRAREFYHKGRQYVVRDGKVVIVDEFTGRLMPGRTWRDGLHQAVEAKEGLAPTPLTETVDRMSYQRFFRLFRRVGAITGTAREAAGEFWHVYGLPFAAIPTHRPCIRRELRPKVCPTREAKWRAIVDEIITIHETTGRPLLVGTRSVEDSEHLARLLGGRGIGCRVLNAVRSNEEAAIIAAAGHRGTITIATNMAGRGTDIRLGQDVASLGGLHVIATERHEARRIDRQLFGRAARQGDPGSARAFVSLDDEVLRRFCPGLIRDAARVLTGCSPVVGDRLALFLFDLAQRRAERRAARLRASVAAHDRWIEEHLGRG